MIMIKTGHMNFGDTEVRKFMTIFIDDKETRRAMYNVRVFNETRHNVLKRLNFIKEIYGKQSESEILTDFQMILLNMAKRYKQVGKNFCAYVRNVFCYEIARHIKEFIEKVDNIHYRKTQYLDEMQTYEEEIINEDFMDKVCENNLGIPNLDWINGNSCSEIFATMDKLERTCLVKYYMEDYNDKFIAEFLGLPTFTVNQKRKSALIKLTKNLNVDKSTVKRSRKTNKLIMK